MKRTIGNNSSRYWGAMQAIFTQKFHKIVKIWFVVWRVVSYNAADNPIS